MNQFTKTWPYGTYRKARKAHRCDWGGRPPCDHVIQPGERYFDPAESNPSRAGGFGGYRFCLEHEALV